MDSIIHATQNWTKDYIKALGDTITDLGTFEDSLSEFDKLFTDVTTPGIYKFRLLSYDMDRDCESFLIVGTSISYEDHYVWQLLFDTAPESSGKFLYRRRQPGYDDNGEFGLVWSKFALMYPPLRKGKISDSYLPTVPVEKGGTGATTAEQARQNLGIGDTITDLGHFIFPNDGDLEAAVDEVNATLAECTDSGIYTFSTEGIPGYDMCARAFMFVSQVGVSQSPEGIEVVTQIAYLPCLSSNLCIRTVQADGTYDSFQPWFPKLDYNGTISVGVLPTVPVEKGGTGATTVEEALKNLGAASREDLDALKKPVTATSTNGVAYTATVDGVTELFVGLPLTIVPGRTSASVSTTLNVNNLGAKPIRWQINTYTNNTAAPQSVNWLQANFPVTLMYNGTYWICTNMQAVSASEIRAGTLSTARGGTGATTAAGARTNLGAASQTDFDALVERVAALEAAAASENS